MKYTCPKCGHNGETLKDKNLPLQRLNALYAAFGLDEGLVREYLDCFRVSRESQNSIPKETRLLKELVSMWAIEGFNYRGRGWNATRVQIAEAMTLVCNKQLIGLGNHNYIKAILHKQAMDADAKAEKEKHEAAMNRGRKPGGLAPAGASLPVCLTQAGGGAGSIDWDANKANIKKAKEALTKKCKIP